MGNVSVPVTCTMPTAKVQAQGDGGVGVMVVTIREEKRELIFSVSYVRNTKDICSQKFKVYLVTSLTHEKFDSPFSEIPIQ